MSSQEHSHSVRDQFDRQAREYASSAPHSSGESLQVLRRLASEGGRFDKAIDIATGPGFTACAVAPYCGFVIATDIAPGMLYEARRLAAEKGLTNVGLAFVAAEALPFGDETLDLVTCRTAPHHFHDIEKCLAEVARVLRPGGMFLLADTCTSENATAASWHQDMEKRRDPTHGRNLSASEWRRSIEAIGLTMNFETITRVDMTMNAWTRRSGTPEDMREQIRKDWENAPAEAVSEYRIAPAPGGDFFFSWPCFVSRSVKP
ncbi:MAG: class I SAM-dependent methyltransferase [Dehalococcoidia bacterium]